MDRLKKRAQFVEVAQAARLHRSAFTLQARRREPASGPSRFGFTVTKKTGNAVARNRIRRRLKAAASHSRMAAREGVDYVLVGRRDALTVPFDTLCRDLERALKTIDPDRRRKPRAPGKEDKHVRQ